jgi:hypothetical protein
MGVPAPQEKGWGGAPVKEGRMFFSEEKNQKTFAPAPAA